MSDNTNDSKHLVARARGGDSQALREIFAKHEERLRRMIDVRLDSRLQGRVDVVDLLPETFAEAAKRLDEFLDDSQLSLFLWLRVILGERLQALHRQHLGPKVRDADLDMSIFRDALPTASSAALAAQLLRRHTAPTQAAVRAERLLRLQDALNTLDPLDREVLSLRHFEQLTREESAKALGIPQSDGAKRYIRALKKLKQMLAEMPGGLDSL